MKKIKLFWILLILTNIAFGQKDSMLYSKIELIEDLDYMIKTMEEVHPNIYAYTSKKDFKVEYEKVKNQLKQGMVKYEFYRLIAPLSIALKDGHTAVEPITDDYTKKPEFPFLVEVKDNKIIVTANLSDDKEISYGSIIKSINGIPSKQIINELPKFMEGERYEYKLARISWDLGKLLYNIYGIIGEYTIDFKPFNDKHDKTITVTGISDEKYSKAKFNNYVLWDMKIHPEENYAVLQYMGGPKNWTDKFSNFLMEEFQKLRDNKISNLIIDIRKNEGGASVLGDSLISYLYDKEFSQFSKVEVKVSDQIKQMLVQEEDTTDYNVKNVLNSPIGSMVEWEDEQIKPNNKFHFNGNIYLLTNPFTYSSAVIFAGAIKDYKIATIIGEETGGLASTYGDIYHFKLPNTGLNCRVSFCYFLRPAGYNDKRGVLPDFEIKTTSEDIINDKDTVMKQALDLIKNKAEWEVE